MVVSARAGTTVAVMARGTRPLLPRQDARRTLNLQFHKWRIVGRSGFRELVKRSTLQHSANDRRAGDGAGVWSGPFTVAAVHGFPRRRGSSLAHKKNAAKRVDAGDVGTLPECSEAIGVGTDGAGRSTGQPTTASYSLGAARGVRGDVLQRRANEPVCPDGRRG